MALLIYNEVLATPTIYALFGTWNIIAGGKLSIRRNLMPLLKEPPTGI